MLVKDCMTRHPIMIGANTRASEAQRIMAENHIRHLPVVGDGKRLVGLITRQQLALKPDMLGSLNVWEITRYLAEMTVEKVMIKADRVVTVGPDRTVERAAETLAQKKIGCLPVLDADGAVVGIITEIDLLKAFRDMLGLPSDGVRVTVRMPDRKGEFAKITNAVSKQGWAIMGIGSFPAPRREGYWDMVLKIADVSQAEVKEVLSQVPDQELVDVREIV